MKTNTSNSKPKTVVANGIDLETLGKTLEKRGTDTGKALEAAHEKGAAGLTSSTLDVMRELHAMRDTIQLEGSLKVYWDALYTSAPNYCKEVSRAKQTKSESLKIMRAWDGGARFAFAGLTVMTKRAGAFLTTPGAKTPGAKTPGAKTPGAKTPGAKTPGAKTPAIDVTPKANSAKGAMAFLLQQVAMLQAYSEKNKSLISDSARDAIADCLAELESIPQD